MESAVGTSLCKKDCSFNFDAMLQVVSIISFCHENRRLCALQNRRIVRLIIRQLSFNRFSHPPGGLAQDRIVEMDVAIGTPKRDRHHFKKNDKCRQRRWVSRLGANPPPWSSPNLTPETFCLAYPKALKYDCFC